MLIRLVFKLEMMVGLCQEHGLTRGVVEERKFNNLQDEKIRFFSSRKNGKFIPRALFIVFKISSVVDSLKTGVLKHLYNLAKFIRGNEDAANNYARRHYTIGKDQIEK